MSEPEVTQEIPPEELPKPPEQPREPGRPGEGRPWTDPEPPPWEGPKVPPEAPEPRLPPEPEQPREPELRATTAKYP
jgi:hypothetical protein